MIPTKTLSKQKLQPEAIKSSLVINKQPAVDKLHQVNRLLSLTHRNTISYVAANVARIFFIYEYSWCLHCVSKKFIR